MKIWFLLTLSVLVLCRQSCAQGFGRVFAGSDGTGANSSNLAPFSSGGSRYQQVYVSSQFPGPEFGYSGLWISNIAFRVDASGPGWQGTYPNIQINLSTTQLQPNSLSPVFNNNVGLNDMVVFAGSWSGTIPWPSSPGTFDLRFDFSQGFFYSPAQGNLLLDIRMLGVGINPSRLDALQGAPQVSSSVFSSSGGSSGITDALALVTRIQGQLVPIPEPSAYLLFGLGFLMLLVVKQRS